MVDGNSKVDRCRSGLKVMTQRMSCIELVIGVVCRRGLLPVWTLLSMKGTVSKKEVAMEMPGGKRLDKRNTSLCIGGQHKKQQQSTDMECR